MTINQVDVIIPVILEPVKSLPKELSRRQWIDLSGRRGPNDIESAVIRITSATNQAGLICPTT